MAAIGSVIKAIYALLTGAPAASGNDWGRNFAGAAVAALPSAA